MKIPCTIRNSQIFPHDNVTLLEMNRTYKPYDIYILVYGSNMHKR